MKPPRHLQHAAPAEEAIARALDELAPGLDPLAASAALRRRMPAELARRAAEQLALRRRAARRFPVAERCLFTRKGLEQATRQPVARARAREIRGLLGETLVLDATCGVGGDALALAGLGLELVAADRDLEVARCAAWNLAAAGRASRVLVADALRPPLWPEVLVLDPDRRAEGRRSLRPRSWSPPLPEALAVAARFPGACIKLSPSAAADLVEGWIPPGLPHRFQWVSSARELCEVALWTGTLSGEGGREVLAIGGEDGEGEARLGGPPAEVAFLAPGKVATISFLAEPDPAVIRSGLLGNLAQILGMAPVGPGIAFLGGEREPPKGPARKLVRLWRVAGSSPADRRRVRALLAEHGVGPLDVMARGHPDPPETLAHRLRGRGERRGLLAVARLERGHRAFLLEPA